jgi:general secretion pathway protein K
MRSLLAQALSRLTASMSGSVTSKGKRDEGGFILVIVIWLALLLALFANSFTASTRSHLRLTASLVGNAQAEALADAGVNLAMLTLSENSQAVVAGQAGRIAVGGMAYTCAIEGHGSVRIVVQDEGGLVNINRAGTRLLAALFAGLGASPEAASRYADAIADYRDLDDDRRPNGAEKAEYEAAGRPSWPKNSSFDLNEELDQVLGFDRALAAAARPYISVHSSTAGVDPLSVPADLARIIARGAAALDGAASLKSGFEHELPAEFAGASSRRVFRVTSTAVTTAGAAFVREAVVDLQSPSIGIPWLRMWRIGSNAEEARVELASLAPC